MSAQDDKLQEMYMEFQMLTQNLKMLEDQQQILMQQMEEFYFGEGQQLPEGWTPQTAQTKG